MNFVLVHGTWLGGWCWRDVARSLRAAGHDVYTPTLTGLGERAHLFNSTVRLSTFIDDICAVIQCEELSDVILVGHSIGGMVVSGVIDRIPTSIKQVIFLDALIAQHGQSALMLFPPAVQAQRAQTTDADELRLGISTPDKFGMLEPQQMAWVMRRVRAHPMHSYTEPLALRFPLGNGLPITYVAMTKPAYAPLASVHAWVKQQSGWTWRELEASHVPMITAPDLLTHELLDIVSQK